MLPLNTWFTGGLPPQSRASLGRGSFAVSSHAHPVNLLSAAHPLIVFLFVLTLYASNTHKTLAGNTLRIEHGAIESPVHRDAAITELAFTARAPSQIRFWSRYESGPHSPLSKTVGTIFLCLRNDQNERTSSSSSEIEAIVTFSSEMAPFERITH
jgi:hypothetical protein